MVEKAKVSNVFKEVFTSKQINSHTTGYYHRIIKMLRIKHRLNLLLDCGLNTGRAEKVGDAEHLTHILQIHSMIAGF